MMASRSYLYGTSSRYQSVPWFLAGCTGKQASKIASERASYSSESSEEVPGVAGSGGKHANSVMCVLFVF